MFFLKGRDDCRMRCYLCQCCCEGVADKAQCVNEGNRLEKRTEGIPRFKVIWTNILVWYIFPNASVKSTDYMYVQVNIIFKLICRLLFIFFPFQICVYLCACLKSLPGWEGGEKPAFCVVCTQFLGHFLTFSHHYRHPSSTSDPGMLVHGKVWAQSVGRPK